MFHVSTVSNMYPLYNFSLFLHNLIRDSFHLVEHLNGSVFDPNYVLSSLDVISLFTNIPVKLALNSIDRRWVYISAKTNISKNEFIIAVRFILNSTFFTFNNRTYRQVQFGTPMGSPLSPIITDIVMQDLEEIALKKLSAQPLFYFRYVDDILLALPSDIVNDILNIFNSLHTRLQFTLEVGTNGRLSFLDTILIIDNQNYI